MKLQTLATFFALSASAMAASNHSGITGDICTDPLTVVDGANAFDTTANTDSGFHDGSCVSRDGFTDIWFTYTATGSGAYSIETCGSDFDTVLRVLEGPDCSTLTCLAGNDDACATSSGSNFASTVTPTLVAGNTYYIHIEGWGATDIGAGTLTINAPAPPPPPASGDVCTDAITAVNGGNPFDTTGLTDSGFHDGSCVSRNGFTDIWFTYTATASGEYTIDTCGADIDTVLRVLEGPDCSTLTCLVGNDDACQTSTGTNFASSVNATLTAGNTYSIHIEGWGTSDIGAGTLTITPPPTGDTCAEALPAAAGGNPFDTTGLIDSGFHDGSCVSRDGFTDIWFTFDATKNGVHTIDTCGADIDTVLRVLEGPDCSTLTCLAGNDDACATSTGTNFASSVDLTLTAGNSYYIHIEGWGASDIGAGTLTITEPTGGDLCIAPLALEMGAAQPFDTSGFTDSGVANSCTFNGLGQSPDIWYSFVQTSAYGATISTCGSSLDTTLEAYKGTDCSALVSVACNDDTCGLQSEISIGGSPGDVFLIRLGGFNGSTGTGTIIATPNGPEAYCVGTPTLGGNGGAAGGAVYFDVTATQDISISSWYTNTSVTAGDPVSQTIYVNTADVTHIGYEQDPSVWQVIGTGSGASAGQNNPTGIRADSAILLPAGTYGICLVNDANTNHRYTNGNGTNEIATSGDGIVTISAGSGQNIPFSSSVFNPRVWNGGFCYDQPGIGTNYCTANANSTGVPASMSASGSTLVTLNQLVLSTSDLPSGSVGYYLASMDQGFTANPGGSSGNLCLGGTIGRAMGDQVVSTGTGSVNLPMSLCLPFNLGGSIAAGDTWNFQLWFRDIGTGGVTSNFSDGYSITFQ